MAQEAPLSRVKSGFDSRWERMRENIQAWIQEVEAARPAIDALVAKLADYGLAVAPEDSREVGALPYIVEFREGDALTTIRIVLKDHNCDSDMVITNMTTLPHSEKSKGYGSKAIAAILEWATDNQLKTVRAIQVNNERSAHFWEKNGFIALENQTGDYLKTLS